MAYERRCEVCKTEIAGRVAYTRVVSKRKKAPERVYVCPECFFEKLKEKERDEYEREIGLGPLTRVEL